MKNGLIFVLWAWTTFAFAAEDESLQQKIDAARARLDAAASELAALHKQDAIEIEMAAPERRVSLGVLLMPDGNGSVELAGVTPDGAAAEAGLQAGDVLVAINGVDLREGDGRSAVSHVLRVLSDVAPGDVVRIDYTRGDQSLSADVTARDPIAAPPMSFAMSTMAFSPGPGAPAAPLMSRGMIDGIEVFDVNEDLGRYFGVSEGVLVLRAPPAKDAGGLLAGDIVRAVDGKSIGTSAEFFGALGGKGDVAVEVQRDGAVMTVQVLSADHGLPPPMPIGMPMPGRAVRVIELDGDSPNESGVSTGAVVIRARDE
jgi:S1-C subfamily serine protease